MVLRNLLHAFGHAHEFQQMVVYSSRVPHGSEDLSMLAKLGKQAVGMPQAVKGCTLRVLHQRMEGKTSTQC
jgi:hypothetical protein